MAKESRRSRRGDWEQLRQGLTSGGSKGVEERETVPDKACGKCKNFYEQTYASDGRGFCNILKIGSNIKAESPVFVLEGEVNLMCMFNMDASKCKHYDLMELIDTDGYECSDPKFRRSQRQMEKTIKK